MYNVYTCIFMVEINSRGILYINCIGCAVQSQCFNLCSFPREWEFPRRKPITKLGDCLSTVTSCYMRTCTWPAYAYDCIDSSLAHYCCVALTLCAHEANCVHIEHHDMQRYSWMEPERVYMTLFASCQAV